MLVIKKVDENNIDIIQDGKLIPSSSVYYVEAHSGRIVLKNKANGRIEYSDDFKNILVQSDPNEEPQSFSSPKEVKEALNLFVGLGFSQGGDNPSTPSWEIPTLQQVANSGNSTSKTLRHAPASKSNESSTLGQVLDIAEEVPISESDFEALTPEEQGEKNYIVIL